MIVITLTKYNNSLSGKYNFSDGDVLVDIDSSDGNFDILFPDLKSINNRVFIFKNLGVNVVNIVTSNGQIIDYPGTFHIELKQNESVFLISNGKDKIISL